MRKLYNGKTLTERVKYSGIPFTTLKGRLRIGRTIEQAIGIEPRKNFYQGMSLSQTAKKFGLDRSCITERLKRGWSIEEAIGINDRIRYNKNLQKRMEVRQMLELGEKYEDIAKKFGVCRQTINYMAAKLGIRRHKMQWDKGEPRLPLLESNSDKKCEEKPSFII